MLKQMRILFIGNSHTYYHGMPFQARELMKHAGVASEITMIAHPGQNLLWHSDYPATQQALSFDSWDHVVLQQATHPFAGAEPLCDGISRLLDLMPSDRSVWLYNTWCEKALPENQARIDNAFSKASKRFKLPVVRVARVWHEIEARTADPAVRNLYDSDDKHAGRTGSYVTALCMVRAITGKSVIGLPCCLRCNGRVINRVSRAAAALYQEVAEELVSRREPRRKAES
jgi:hypothetical protein